VLQEKAGPERLCFTLLPGMIDRVVVVVEVSVVPTQAVGLGVGAAICPHISVAVAPVAASLVVVCRRPTRRLWTILSREVSIERFGAPRGDHEPRVCGLAACQNFSVLRQRRREKLLLPVSFRATSLSAGFVCS